LGAFSNDATARASLALVNVSSPPLKSIVSFLPTLIPSESSRRAISLSSERCIGALDRPRAEAIVGLKY
jgi:hypothetical protein